MEKIVQGDGPFLSDCAQLWDAVWTLALIPLHRSLGVGNTLEKSKKLNHCTVTQALTRRIIQTWHGKRAAFPSGLWYPTAWKSKGRTDCRLCLPRRAEPPGSSAGIALTVSQCLPCPCQHNCNVAGMVTAKINWHIYTFLYMYLLCDSRWD